MHVKSNNLRKITHAAWKGHQKEFELQTNTIAYLQLVTYNV